MHAGLYTHTFAYNHILLTVQGGFSERAEPWKTYLWKSVLLSRHAAGIHTSWNLLRSPLALFPDIMSCTWGSSKSWLQGSCCQIHVQKNRSGGDPWSCNSPGLEMSSLTSLGALHCSPKPRRVTRWHHSYGQVWQRRLGWGPQQPAGQGWSAWFPYVSCFSGLCHSCLKASSALFSSPVQQP